MGASSQRITVEEWQKRLADTFTVKGLIGGSLQPIFRAEDAAGSYLVNTFRGQNVLLDAFQSFFVETLTFANNQITTNGWPKDRIHYPVALASFFNLFRRCRACEILYMKGYPLDAYALMRDIKDRTFMLAGVAHNMTTFPRVIGAPATSLKDPKEYKRQSTKIRKKAEHRITNRLMGETSGLPTDHQKHLKVWDDFFNYEVHGGGVSLTQELSAMSKGKIPQIGPSVHRDAFVIYMNRSAELSWLIVRVLPFLQLSKESFGSDWEHKRQVLDDSFRFMVEGLGNLGKQIAPAFITMIDTRFFFNQPFYYFEADGSDSLSRTAVPRPAP